MGDPIVFYDGDCRLCDAAVRFIRRHDRTGRIRFETLRSPWAEELRRAGSIPPHFATIVVLDGNRTYVSSDAIVHIATSFDGAWRWLSVARIVPRPLRDAIYRAIAANRFRA